MKKMTEATSQMVNVSASEWASPILVVGYMHSGTTLVRQLLGNSPEVFPLPGETRFFERVPSLARQLSRRPPTRRLELAVELVKRERCFTRHLATLQELEVVDVGEEGTDGDPDALLARVFDRIARFLARRRGARRWLEKTPSHVWCLPEIFNWLPECRVVEVIRDPRDILASKRIRTATVTSGRYRPEQIRAKRLEKDYDPVLDALSWRSAAAAGRRAAQRRPDGVFRLKYEELVAAPAEVMRPLCAWLGLEFTEEVLRTRFANPARREGLREGIYASSRGQYAELLPPAHVAVCQWLAGREMSASQYQLLPLEGGPCARGVLSLLGSPFALGRRLWKRLRLGGWAFLGKVVGGYATRAGSLLRGKAVQ